jgi:L-ascorbate metabolism protein UlaG (beta-lactamase superfamily)
MNIRQIRNATIVLHYGGQIFLIDPFLAEKGAYPPFRNTPNQDQSNPTVDLNVPVEEIIKADAVIVTHLHPDHFDPAAIAVLPKNIHILAQSEEDAETIKREGFQRVESLTNVSSIGSVSITKTSGQHGKGELAVQMGPVSGVVFKHPEEKTLYIAGDTVWCDDVQQTITTHEPDVIIVNGGAAQFLQGDPITMSKENIYETYMAAPKASVIVSHMEALNHCVLTRDELKQFIEEKEVTSRIFVPNDGESLSF